jgi:hypothetical protein
MRRTSPESGHDGWRLPWRAAARKCRRRTEDFALRDQARLARPADSPGTVGHAELAQRVVDVLQWRDGVDDLGEMLPEGRAAPSSTAWRAPGFRGMTDPAGGAVRICRGYGISPSSRARVTASVRLVAASLPSTWLTCFLTVSRVTTS